MRTLATCALAVLMLVGCGSSSNGSAGLAPRPRTYTLSVASGDGQSGVAIIQPVSVTVSVGSAQIQAPLSPVPVSAPLPLPLVVEVRDAATGALVDGVQVQFWNSPHDVDLLGSATSGLDPRFSNGIKFSPTRGQAAVAAQPVHIGVWHVEAQVDPASGTSNAVEFTVTGT